MQLLEVEVKIAGPNTWRVICPFCGRAHFHGMSGGLGHRVPDCATDKGHDVMSDGVTYRRQDGYILVAPKNAKSF
jgi:hypothetical protein